MKSDLRRHAVVDDGATRIAPDPVSLVLPALAALGTVSSLSAVIWAADENAATRTKQKRKPAQAVRELEADCIRLQDIFRRIERTTRMLNADRPVQSSLKFGMHGLKVSQHSFVLFQLLVQDLADVQSHISKNVFDVMCAIEDSMIDAPDEIFYGFGDAQERLNELIFERNTLEAVASAGEAIAEQLAGLVRELKGHIVG